MSLPDCAELTCKYWMWNPLKIRNSCVTIYLLGFVSSQELNATMLISLVFFAGITWADICRTLLYFIKCYEKLACPVSLNTCLRTCCLLCRTPYSHHFSEVNLAQNIFFFWLCNFYKQNSLYSEPPPGYLLALHEKSY